jgi:hypothetical protein
MNRLRGKSVWEKKQVGLWRKRWQESFPALVAIECRESSAALRRAIEDVLADAPRSGAPGTFTAEQVTQILALACEPPSQSGRPIDAWTGRELADEAQTRGIVESISRSQVNRYLAEAALQPHRSRYWLNTTEKDPQQFQQQVEAVCDCYLQATTLYHQQDTHTVCVDEMTGIQALERNAKEIPMIGPTPSRSTGPTRGVPLRNRPISSPPPGGKNGQAGNCVPKSRW